MDDKRRFYYFLPISIAGPIITIADLVISKHFCLEHFLLLCGSAVFAVLWYFFRHEDTFRPALVITYNVYLHLIFPFMALSGRLIWLFVIVPFWMMLLLVVPRRPSMIHIGISATECLVFFVMSGIGSTGPNVQQTSLGLMICAVILYTFSMVRRDLEKEEEHLKAENEYLRATNDSLAQLNTRDPLTGLLNRRYYDDHILELTSESASFNTPLSCIFLDIDHFKSINDTYGHKIGDKALKSVARVLMTSVKSDEDVVCRYGGEEFVLLLKIDLNAACDRAEKIRHDVETLEIKETGPFTISCGVAPYIRGSQPEALVKRADEMMYNAKQSGRNRVCVDWDNGRIE